MMIVHRRIEMVTRDAPAREGGDCPFCCNRTVEQWRYTPVCAWCASWATEASWELVEA